MRDDDTPNGMRNERDRDELYRGSYETSADSAPMHSEWTIPPPPVVDEKLSPFPWGDGPKVDEKRDTFATGYQRDGSADKPGYEMLPPDALEELALLYTEGAKKYGRSNFRKGAPITRTCASMLRHAFKALRGDEDEGNTDRARRVRHFIATAWNALAAAQHLIDIDKGVLPADLDDRA